MVPSQYWLSALVLISSFVTAQKDNGPQCDCFNTNGSSAAYFANHRFYDFRNIVSPPTSSPAVLTNARNAANAPATSSYFLTPQFMADWAIQNWNNSDSIGNDPLGASVLMVNSWNNVYIEKSAENSPSYSTYLTLRTNRGATFQSAGEIESTITNYKFLSARFLARITGRPGACAGMFTYRGPVTKSHSISAVQEVDIEILTRDPGNKVQLTNQPSVTPDGDVNPEVTANVTVPGPDWRQWNEYRLDWTPGMSTWYINGVQMAAISIQAPKDPSGLILNMWSDGGSWAGNMSASDSAYLQFQWIEVAYNTSGAPRLRRDPDTEPEISHQMDVFGPHGMLARSNLESPRTIESRANSGCAVVCSVDQNVTIGTKGIPVMVSNNTGTAPGSMSGNTKSLLQTWGFGIAMMLSWRFLFL